MEPQELAPLNHSISSTRVFAEGAPLIVVAKHNGVDRLIPAIHFVKVVSKEEGFQIHIQETSDDSVVSSIQSIEQITTYLHNNSVTTLKLECTATAFCSLCITWNRITLENITNLIIDCTEGPIANALQIKNMKTLSFAFLLSCQNVGNIRLTNGVIQCINPSKKRSYPTQNKKLSLKCKQLKFSLADVSYCLENLPFEHGATINLPYSLRNEITELAQKQDQYSMKRFKLNGLKFVYGNKLFKIRYSLENTVMTAVFVITGFVVVIMLSLMFYCLFGLRTQF